MSLFPIRSGRKRVLLAEAGAALVAAVLVAGCGNNYRPVVTPVNSNGPAAQATSFAAVVSSPSPSSPGVATIIDYAGDTVLAEAPIGIGPLAFTIDEVGGTGYTYNSDSTITNFPVSSTLQQKLETVTTLPAGAQPININAPSSGLWIGDLDGNVADEFSGVPEAFKLSVPVATVSDPTTSTPVFITGSPLSNGQREYVINQNLGATANAGVACNVSPTTQPNGVAVPIEIVSNTTDTPIALDPFAVATGSTLARCPVFAVQSSDQRRLFVLNRGSDTISVINSQNNALDECAPFLNQNNQPVTCHPILPLSTAAVTALGTAVTAAGVTGVPTAPPNANANLGPIAGPIYAEYNTATSQLVVANYDGNTVSVIDVSTDQYGNDSPTFGTTYTIPVGPFPASVTVLYDGSRAYTANQGDCGTGACTSSSNGTVTVVNLSTHTVEKTLPVTGLPRTLVSTQNSLFGKVYVAAPNTNELSIIETETDLLDTTINIEGNVVDVRTTTQSGSSQSVNSYSGSINVKNLVFSSRVPGWGQPCNLPPTVMNSLYPSGYTLQECQAIP